MFTTSIVIAFCMAIFPQPTQSDPAVPAHLATSYSPDQLRFGYQEGVIVTYAYPPTVKIDWIASGLSNAAPDHTLPVSYVDGDLIVGNHSFSKRDQRFRVGLTPTASAVLDKKSILIAGIDQHDNTVVEIWSLSYGAGTPPTEPSLNVNAVTGITSVEVTLPTRTSIQRIHSENAVGRKLVRNLCTIRTAGTNSTSALVQFEDSGDVYKMELASGALTLLSSSTGGGLGSVPSLSTVSHMTLKFGDRTNYGFVYSLIFAIADDQPGQITPSVLFFDQDRNGTIDSVLELPDAVYESQGWLDPSNYITSWNY